MEFIFIVVFAGVASLVITLFDGCSSETFAGLFVIFFIAVGIITLFVGLSSPQTEYEESKVELLKVIKNGKESDDYYSLDKNGDLILNNGTTQEAYHIREIQESIDGKAYLIRVEHTWDESSLRNSITPQVSNDGYWKLVLP